MCGEASHSTTEGWAMCVGKHPAQLLFLRLPCFHSDPLNDKAGAAPPVRPAEVGIALPLQLHHQQFSDVHLRINQEGVGFICGDLRPEGKFHKFGYFQKSAFSPP